MGDASDAVAVPRAKRAASDDEAERCEEHLAAIRGLAATIGRDVTVMEICGGHTNVIMKYGIRDILPSNIRLISGPGCPVCVSSQHDIDAMIALATAGIPVATYGDMLRVPGSERSLDEARAQGAPIFEIYSAEEVLRLRERHPGIVFFGIGFETTTPMTAYLLEKGVTVYSVHKLVPPAMRSLLDGEVKIDAFLDPGHVSAITGTAMYRAIGVPQAIAGFSPERILRGLALLLRLVADGETSVVNAYPEVVRQDGNPKAQTLVEKHLTVVDSDWRGLGVIPRSGLDVKDPRLNARVTHAGIIAAVPPPKRRGCRCGEVLKGVIDPPACPLYGKACTPQRPMGGCMVSDEGTCSIFYRYGTGLAGTARDPATAEHDGAAAEPAAKPGERD